MMQSSIKRFGAVLACAVLGLLPAPSSSGDAIAGPRLRPQDPSSAPSPQTAEPTEPAVSSAVEEIRRRGRLIMLCFPTLGGGVSPNLDYGTTRRQGKPEHFLGFEVELMKRLAARLGVELEIHTLEEPGFGVLIPALVAGRADIVASTLSVTPERREHVDFSSPYEEVFQVVAVRPESRIRGVADLMDKTAVTSRGSSHHEHLLRLGFPEKQIHFVEFVEEYYTAVIDGDADFTLTDSFYPDHLDELQGSGTDVPVKVAFALPNVDVIAAALPKGSDLKPFLDRLIAELKADGSLEAMRRAARIERASLLGIKSREQR